MKITHRIVTPATAAEWLARFNTHNRTIAPKRVEQMVASIHRGEWAETETISFAGMLDSDDAVLLNGQHRLSAVARSGKEQRMIVIEDVDPAAQLVMDVGKPRSFGDVLTLEGWPNANTLAGAVRLCWLQERGLVAVSGGNNRAAPTHGQLLAWLHEHPGISEAVRRARRLRTQSEFRVSTAAATVAYWNFQHLDAEEADAFFEAFETGAALAEGDPVLALRRWYVNASGRTREQPSAGLQLALITKTWNAYRTGRAMKLLKFTAFGPLAEPMPVAV